MFKKLKEKMFKLVDHVSGYDKKMILKKFKLPNGMIENYFVSNDGDSVQILAFTKNKEVILVEQYRPSIEIHSTELPGGGLEENEDAKEAAKRELLEETGHSCGKIEFLHKQNYGIYSTGIRHTYVAFDCEKKKDLDLDPNEFLKVVIVPLDKIKEMIKKGDIRGWDSVYMALDKYQML